MAQNNKEFNHLKKIDFMKKIISNFEKISVIIYIWRKHFLKKLL